MTTLLALLIVFLAGILLVRRMDVRFVLLACGLLLCLLPLKPQEALNTFVQALTNSSLIQAICSTMGFAGVVRLTGCDRHLVMLLAKPMQRIGLFLIPACSAVSFLVNIALPSAAGVAAVVGSTFIPLMIRAGVKPAAAGASILLGTFGSMLSPGFSHNTFIGELSGTTAVEVIAFHTPYTLLAFVIGAFLLTFVCFFDKDYVAPKGSIDQELEKFKVNYFYAIAPFVPLLIIATGLVLEKPLGIAQAMLVGVIYALLITRANPQIVSSHFFTEMGSSYANVIGIAVAASVFTVGLKVSGLQIAFLEMLNGSSDMLRWTGSFGPFLMAIMTGSSDTATFAFNGAITPHASEFGMPIQSFGALVALCAQLGRALSPISGAVILVCGLTNVRPTELFRRNWIPLSIPVIVLTLTMV